MKRAASPIAFAAVAQAVANVNGELAFQLTDLGQKQLLFAGIGLFSGLDLPILAIVLILVGVAMFQSVTRVEFDRLEIAVPAISDGVGSGEVIRGIGEEWPTYLAYFISFMTIGAVWIEHCALVDALGTGSTTVVAAVAGAVFTPLAGASESVGRTMRRGATVIYESTVYPGATEEVCVPILEKHSGMRWRQVGPANMSGRVTDVEGIPDVTLAQELDTYFVEASADLESAVKRHGFGVRLAHRESIQLMLGGLAMKIEIGRLLVMKAAWELDRGGFAQARARTDHPGLGSGQRARLFAAQLETADCRGGVRRALGLGAALQGVQRPSRSGWNWRTAVGL